MKRLLKKIINSILIIIFLTLYISNVCAIEPEEINEEQFEFKTISEIKQQMIDKENKKMFMLITEEDFEQLSEDLFECLNSQEDNKLKRGYNSLVKEHKSIIENDVPKVAFDKPSSDYNRDEKDDIGEESKKRYTVVFKNDMPEVLFLYKINKSWSQQENDEFFVKATKYKNWIKKQVLAVCDADEEIGDFGGWLYGSYLNLGEVAYGISLAYNWMYDDLTEQERKIIEESIIKYSIKVFNEKDFNNYFTAEHSSTNTNRNQVINSGIALNALVLLNSGYQLDNKLDENADKIDNIFYIKDKDGNYIKENDEDVEINLNDSILNDMVDEENLVLDFNDLLYAIIGKSINLQAKFFLNRLEGGGYPEGPSYYRYGMSFTNYFLSSLYNLSKTDFGVMNIKALYDSLLYPVYLESSSNKVFNYGDVSEESSNINSVSNTRMIWMANYYISKGEEEKLENAYLLYNLEARYTWGLYNMIWYKNEYGENAEEYNAYERDYLFNNISVAVINKSFERQTNDIYIATKAGKVQRSHGDLDLGSFVLDALGERWIDDFGMESYTALNIGNTRYGRWNYYKKRAEGHSTIVINPVTKEAYSDELNFYYMPADQYIYAETSIEEFIKNDEYSYVTMDLSDAYNRYNKNKQTESPAYDAKVERTIGVYENRSIAKLTDVFKLDKERNIYSFLNIANDVVSIDIAEDGKSAVLSKENGKKLKVELICSKPAEFKKMSKKPLSDFLNGINDYDEENYSFNENLTDIDKEKLYINLYAKNAVVEVKIIPVYINQVDVSYEDVIQNNIHYVDVTITANEKMKEVDGWNLSEDKKTLTKRYTANTKEEIKIYDMAGNETVKKVEINNIDHGGLNGIEIKKAKTRYIEGQSFDKDKLEVEVMYNDGTSQIINSRNLNLDIIDGENLAVGKEIVTISYTENEETKVVNQNIEVLGIYNINYELDGGTNSVDNPKTYTIEDEIELKSAEKEGYIFDGWYEDAEFTEEKITNIKNRTGNITLYAKWIIKGDINKDNNINVTDLLLLKRHLIAGTKENWKLTGDMLKIADLNNDNKVNITDLLLLKRIILNKD